MNPSQLLIEPLSSDSLPDFLVFFDGEAFSDNPEWSSCYCQCFYEDHTKVKWEARSRSENRSFAVDRGESGRMQGYLAYLDQKVVGWCNAAPRSMLHCLDAEPIASASVTGCILCFLVAPSARGQGVAKALLGTACEGLRDQGLLFVEANPRPLAQGDAENHFGPLAMYLSAGFTVDRTDEDGSVWVKKPL